LKKPPEPVLLGDGCKSRLLFAKIGMAIWFQVSGVRDDEQRRWHLTPGIREGINMGFFLNPYYGQF
jgi:hypothetical protein